MTTSHSDRSRGLVSLFGACLLLGSIALAGCETSDDEPEPASAPPPAPPNPPSPGAPPLAAPVIPLDGTPPPAIGSSYWGAGGTSTGGQGQPVGDLECVYPSPIEYHVHAHLSILLNGEALSIPGHVGIVELTPTTECHYPVHTHDRTGMIHLHGTEPTDFTLGQFFAIWGQPLERNNVAGHVGLPAVVYVVDDGVASEYTGDLTALQLISRRHITIQLGTPITAIPQFTWTGP